MEFKLVDHDDSLEEEIVDDAQNEELSDEIENDDEVIENEIEDEDSVVDEDVEIEDDEYDYIDIEDNEALIEYIKNNEDVVNALKGSDTQDIPDDVKKYLEFKKETNGRGLSDFLEYQKDFSSMSSEDKVKKYLSESNPELSKEEIQEEYDDLYGYDEELDNESEVRKKKRELKKITSTADSYFDEQKSKWGVPLGSDDKNVPEEYVQSKKELDEIRQQEATRLEEDSDRNKFFMEKTNSVFNDDFEGFDFNIGDDIYSYGINNGKEVAESQSNPMNFFSKFIDEDGYIKDVEGYHKALYVASNYETVIKNIVDTALSNQIEEDSKFSKNIDMGKARKSPESLKSGISFKIIE